MATADLAKKSRKRPVIADARGDDRDESSRCRKGNRGGAPFFSTEGGSMQSSASESLAFKSACSQALKRAGELAPIGRDRIVADLRIRFDYRGEYVAYIDRFKIVERVRRLSREVLAHSRSLKELQHAVDGASERDQPNVIVAYVDEDDESVSLPYELAGR